jgi:hypothetical protein
MSSSYLDDSPGFKIPPVWLLPPCALTPSWLVARVPCA